jgi:hypothetical protein
MRPGPVKIPLPALCSAPALARPDRGVGALARGAMPSATVAPSTQDLKATAQAAYGGAFAPGHVIGPVALQRLSDSIKTTVAANAFDPALHPGGMAVVNRVAAFPQPGAVAASWRALGQLCRASIICAGSPGSWARVDLQRVGWVASFKAR